MSRVLTTSAGQFSTGPGMAPRTPESALFHTSSGSPSLTRHTCVRSRPLVAKLHPWFTLCRTMVGARPFQSANGPSTCAMRVAACTIPVYFGGGGGGAAGGGQETAGEEVGLRGLLARGARLEEGHVREAPAQRRPELAFVAPLEKLAKKCSPWL
mmetsp:Transcript_3409/g.5539  ORF Transcript_3409/g.5539 Transcript_3409/m.5539 type:complete len:155 (-) Transcript_3409:337-801(-)